MSPHTGDGTLTVAEHAWNMGIGEVHSSVEHAFGIVLWDWPFLCSSWKHQVFRMACGLCIMQWFFLLMCATVLCPTTAQCYNCMPSSYRNIHN